MKKNLRILLVVLIALILRLNPVNAASKCDYSEQVELNNAVANIKVSYEEAEGQVDSSLLLPNDSGSSNAKYYYFKVQVYNLTEDFYLKITNDINEEAKYLRYGDSESGVIEFDWKDLDEVANFTITVYSSNTTGCPNEEYRIISLTLPRYNRYSSYAVCNENENFYLCQKYITEIEDVDYTTFRNKLEAYEKKVIIEEEKKQEANKSFKEKVFDFIKENKMTVIAVSTIIVIGGVVTTVIVVKKRRSRVL